jgi:hypothetical protein
MMSYPMIGKKYYVKFLTMSFPTRLFLICLL